MNDVLHQLERLFGGRVVAIATVCVAVYYAVIGSAKLFESLRAASKRRLALEEQRLRLEVLKLELEVAALRKLHPDVVILEPPSSAREQLRDQHTAARGPILLVFTQALALNLLGSASAVFVITMASTIAALRDREWLWLYLFILVAYFALSVIAIMFGMFRIGLRLRDRSHVAYAISIGIGIGVPLVALLMLW